MNLQDLLLTEARKQQIPVTIYLIGGHQMKGLVVGTDTCVVMLNCEGKQILIYKHAISTITPIKKLLLPQVEETTTQQ